MTSRDTVFTKTQAKDLLIPRENYFNHRLNWFMQSKSGSYIESSNKWSADIFATFFRLKIFFQSNSNFLKSVPSSHQFSKATLIWLIQNSPPKCIILCDIFTSQKIQLGGLVTSFGLLAQHYLDKTSLR